MIMIVASYIIVPNQPTPKGFLWLSDCDQVTRKGHTPLIYIYKGKPNHNIIETMRNSLGKILEYYYPLAGRLNLAKSGRMELDCNAKGVTLLEAESTKSMGDYGDFSPLVIQELVPKLDYTQPIEELPLLSVQLTRFHGDEGFALGVGFSHTLGDGHSCIQLINSWAKVARGDTLESNAKPFLDRTILKLLHSPSTSRFDHPELKPLPLKLGSSDNIEEQQKEVTIVLLKLTSNQVEILKKKANDGSMKKGSRPFSRFEAIGAHVWRCASKARELDKNQPTVIRFNGDIRSRLIPPLPRTYFGNALAATATPKAYVGEIISNQLSYAAQKIREAIEMFRNDYIRSQLNVVLGEQHLRNIKSFFLGQGEPMNVQYTVNPNLHLLSWMSLPVYEADFGWGKPIYFGPASIVNQERALIMLSPDGDGSVIVYMYFQKAHIELFKKLFYEDGSIIGYSSM